MKAENALLWIRRYISVWLVLIVAFVIYIYFYASDTSLGARSQLHHQIDSLKTEIARYRDSVVYYQQLNADLKTDPATMERVIREHYHMKRPHEDVYIFE